VQPPPSPPAQAPPRPPVAAPQGDIRIEYLDQSRIQVRGDATGRIYQFSHREQVRAVDARDAAGLLRTSFFRRA
jgi:hypothetical protein